MGMQGQTKILELESIRGIAALLVVLHHASSWNQTLYNNSIIYNSYLMVDLFFVLSGFVIGKNYGDKITTPRDLMRFEILRFGRLYPVHLFFLLSFIGIEISKYIAATYFGLASPNTQPFRENNASALAEQLLLLQAVFGGAHAMSFNFPAWSISTEFYCYLLFAGVCLAFGRRRLVAFLAIEIVALLLLGMGGADGHELILRCCAGFFLGLLTAKFVQARPFSLPAASPLLALAALLLYLDLKTDDRGDLPIYFLTQALILTLVASKDGPARQLLRSRALSILGTLSYSIYMAHGLVVWLATQLFRVLLKRPELIVDGRSTPQLTTLQAILASLGVIGITLAMSWLTYRRIEQPGRIWFRRLADQHFGRPAPTHLNEATR